MHRPTDYFSDTVYNTKDEMSAPCRWPRLQDENDNCGFLEILRRLLDESEDTKHNIISWNPDGMSFHIHFILLFEQYLMPMYFGDMSACGTSNRQHEPLGNFDSFLGLLRSYGFYRNPNNSILKDTFSHPLFSRDNKDLALQITFHELSSINENRDGWPMPALSDSKKDPSDCHKPKEYQRSNKAYLPRPFRPASQERHNSFQRRINPSSQHPTNKRIFFKEALLQRKCRSPTSFFELLSSTSFDDDNVNNNGDDCEPLCVPSGCKVSLGGIDLTLAPTHYDECANQKHPMINVEPLDHVCHKDYISLHEDLTEALTGICPSTLEHEINKKNSHSA